MILIEGNYPEGRRIVLERLELQLRQLLGPQLRVTQSGVPGYGRTAQVVQLLNTANQTELRDGLTLDFPPEHPIYHMVAHALSATGSIVVVPSENRAKSKTNWPTIVDKLAPYLPVVRVYLDRGFEEAAVHLIRGMYDGKARLAAARYRYGGTGPLETDATMVVGERINPFRPLSSFGFTSHFITGGDCPLAFTSNQGCSYFLHAALEAAGDVYYLTNAIKERNKKWNLSLLQEEIALVKPSRIIAMGAEAAHYLSDLRVNFTQTYHPQYWKRFKNKDVEELVQLLRPIHKHHQTHHS